MNFNYIILLIFVMLFTACGVKNDPVSPKNETIPSLLENYPDIKTNQPLKETRRR